MTVRLALASAPVRLADRYGDFSGAANTEPSFGLACLAAVAMDAGADVRIVEAASLDLSVEEALDRILPFEPHVVGISATTVGIAAAGALAARLKSARPQVRVLVGGCHATAIPEQKAISTPG